MPVRSKARNRCPRCIMREVLCLCDRVPRLETRSRVTIVIHHEELQKTTNTGRLAALALTNSELRVRGKPGCALDTSGLKDPAYAPLFVFPSERAVELTPELVAGLGKPVHLIVPDGTWNQARRVALRETDLAGIPHVRLPPGKPSTYRLRSSPNPANLSTLEAIGRALAIAEGAGGPAIAEALEGLLDVMVERALWSRGKLRAVECRTGIPQSAIALAKASGFPKPTS